MRTISLKLRSHIRTLSVDPSLCLALAPMIPRAAIAVAESGIRTADEIVVLSKAGYSAFLIGERLMRSDEPGLELRGLIDAAESQMAVRPAGDPGALP